MCRAHNALGGHCAWISATGTVRAEGDLDFRGTLGVDNPLPSEFSEIRLCFDLQSDASEEQLATLLRLTERYCVVLQTLANSPRLTASIGLKPDRT